MGCGISYKTSVWLSPECRSPGHSPPGLLVLFPDLPDLRLHGPRPCGRVRRNLGDEMAALSVNPPPQALTSSTVEYENLESEVSALHDDLWEQLNLDIQVKRALGRPRLACALSLPFSFLFKSDQSGFISCFRNFRDLRRGVGSKTKDKVQGHLKQTLNFRLKIIWDSSLRSNHRGWSQAEAWELRLGVRRFMTERI